jgi:hypothetical protein
VRMDLSPGIVRSMRRCRTVVRYAGLRIRLCCWAVAMVVISASGVAACNEGTAPRGSPAVEETRLSEPPYQTQVVGEDPALLDDLPSDADDAGASAGSGSNSGLSPENSSPDLGGVVEEDLDLPAIPAPDPNLANNLGGAGADSCGIPGNECTGVEDDHSEGSETIVQEPPEILVEPGTGDVTESGGDTRDENGGTPTSNAETSSTTSQSG